MRLDLGLGMMFDSHCHLQDERIVGGIDGVIGRARQSGVRRVLCCGADEGDWGDVGRIGAEFGDLVICAFGVHPWHVNQVSDSWDAVLEEYLRGNKSAAVGEIGLDNAVDPRNDDRQIGVFVRQLEIAERLGRPVSIHCRRAWGSLVSIIKDRGGLRFGGAIHSYSGPPDLVRQLEDLGCYLSFSGSIVNPRNRRAVESLKKVSPDRLLIETDSPDILPYGAPGLYNESANIRLVVDRVAVILNKSPDDIAVSTYDNGMRLFARG